MGTLVEQETALVWSGGGRRYFTRKAAVRGAAKAILKREIRAVGEDNIPQPLYEICVKQLVGKIEGGQRPELDWDAANDAVCANIAALDLLAPLIKEEGQ